MTLDFTRIGAELVLGFATSTWHRTSCCCGLKQRAERVYGWDSSRETQRAPSVCAPQLVHHGQLLDFRLMAILAMTSKSKGMGR